MRKFNKSLAVMSLLSPLSAYALGIGDIKLHSALNQNLRAEIPLVNARNEPLSNIQVTLASPNAFARAGLDRQFLLSALRFKPIKKPDGSIVVKVTSTETIREPFLNFLVEVNWPKGKLLREFTLLLDPPVTFKKKTTTITRQPAVRAEPTVSPADNPPSPRIPEPQAAVVSPPVRQTRQHAPRSIGFGDQYGPVARNDTLWKVVKSVKTDNQVTDEQLMIAIFENNHHAFYKKNINALKAGQVLNIPRVDVIARRTNPQAMAEYKRQNDVWYGRISDTPPANTKNQAGATAQAPKSQLKLLVPSDTKIEKDGTFGSGASAGTNEKSKADVAIEMAATVSQENEELKTRLQELESQLEAVQRMVTLKDEQLAALQAKQAIINEAKDSVPDQNPQEEQVVDGDKLTAVGKIGPRENAQPFTNEVGSNGNESPPLEKTVKKPKAISPPPTPPSEPEQGFLSEFISEPYYLAAAGAGTVLLGLLAFVVFRRNRVLASDDAESILTVDRRKQAAEQSSDTDTVTAETTDTTEATTDGAESSFLSEFTPSDFDALDTEHDEVDPISEADVYLAYGRYQQAEDLIRQAIIDSPDRDECKLKLLEIHYARENKEAFETYATELSKDKRNDMEFWEKVVEMGREICPNNVLFAGLGSATETTSNIVELANNKPGDDTDRENDAVTPLDLSKFGAEDVNSEELNASPYDYNPGSGAGGGEIDETLLNSTPGRQDNASIDFDISGAGADEIVEKSEDTLASFGNESDADSGIESFDFESGLSNLESLNKDLADQSGAGEEAAGKSADTDFSDAFTTDFNLDEKALESGGIDDGLSGFTDIDEIENKLDLAKACVDMDDSETAKELLEEVLKQGNDTQKSEARELLDKLEIKG